MSDNTDKITDKEIHTMLSLIAMGDVRLIPELKIAAVIQEAKDLRAKLEAAEQAKKRYWDAIHRQYQRNIGTIRKMEKAEQDRDNLQAAYAVVRGLISEIIVAHGEEIIPNTAEVKSIINKAHSAFHTTSAEAGERVRGLVEALEFYAEQNNYEAFENNRSGGYSDPAIFIDDGDRARKTLAKYHAQVKGVE
jgi:thioesterase domain-containing protein